MIKLQIENKRIEIVIVDGIEIWDDIIIRKAHRDKDGTWVGIRKTLIDVAINRRVKWLNIKVEDVEIEFTVSPEEFLKRSKIIEMPSKYYLLPFKICLFPISDIVRQHNKKIMEDRENNSTEEKEKEESSESTLEKEENNRSGGIEERPEEEPKESEESKEDDDKEEEEEEEGDDKEN